MNIDTEFLRPQKAEALKNIHSDIKKKSRDSAECYRNATVLPVKKIEGDDLAFGRGGVTDEYGLYIENSQTNGRVRGKYTVIDEDIAFRDEKVVYCGFLVNHWGHFLIEAVGRIWFCLEENDADKYIFTVEYNSKRKLHKGNNYYEFLRLSGILDKAEVINVPVKFREVIVPDSSCEGSEFGPGYKRVFDVIVKNALKEQGSVHYNNFSGNNIFLTRSSFKKARRFEFGMDMLDDYFLKNGFEVMCPEKMNLAELIWLLNNAKVCACVSGTVPHNMLFAPDGMSLIIIEKTPRWNEFQAKVNVVRDLNVTYIDANYSLYPVIVGSGPFIYAFNNRLRSFTKKNNYHFPDKKYISKQYKRKCVGNYIKVYRRYYFYQWYVEDWFSMFSDLWVEAYKETDEEVGGLLNGTEPVFVRDIFTFDFWRKRLVKVYKYMMGVYNRR